MRNKSVKYRGLRALQVILLCLFGFSMMSMINGQRSMVNGQRSIDQNPQKQKVRIDLLYADEAVADQNQRPDVQVLRGSVKLKHDSMYMYCDSALIFEKINSVEAFGHCRMEQGDTLFIYGDYMYYDGIAQLAKLRENVRLINRETQLET
ncbi:MAG: OstA-like protein, partial [Bacteroidales bacterium]